MKLSAQKILTTSCNTTSCILGQPLFVLIKNISHVNLKCLHIPTRQELGNNDILSCHKSL